jgi:hypothetical protein
MNGRLPPAQREMQSIGWYVNRLRTMSSDEVRWRLRDAARDLGDRWRFSTGRFPQSHDVGHADPSASPPFRVSALPVGAWQGDLPEPTAGWLARLVARADDLAAHRLTFFNLAGVSAGHPVDWNRDLESGQPTPMSFAPGIDYRDARVAGDAKVVWEPSRHQHFVVLGRAYRATGDERYAQAVVEQLVSWLDQSPFGRGMNWRSPLELAIRVINWVWALDLIHESRAWADAPASRVRHALYLHLWEITRKYSRGSSSNNHLIGEAAGVFIATAYFPDLPNARAWHEASRRILHEQILVQTHPDGGTREQATGYHLFILQFFVAAGMVSRWQRMDFSAAYWSRVQQMFDFVAALLEGGPLPMIGDADDGFVLDLGVRGPDAHGMLAAGAALFDRADFGRAAAGEHEWAHWLLGPSSVDTLARLPTTTPIQLTSRAFPDTGYYLLQAGSAGLDDSVSLVMDCAELGFGALAAHGHADALSIVLRLAGEDVLVDPGTYDYFTYPAWRRYYRSTPAHNTVTVDGQDQSVIAGPFMWSTRANVHGVSWSPSPKGGVVSAEHDGYTRLPDPVRHRRRVELDSEARTVTIRDDILAVGVHEIAIGFHFGERSVLRLDSPHVHVVRGRARMTLTAPAGFSVRAWPSGEGPSPGWVSRGYHSRAAAPALDLRGRTNGTTSFETIIRYGASAGD